MTNFSTSSETTRFSRRSLLHADGRGNFMACFCKVHLSVHPRLCLRCSYLCMSTMHTRCRHLLHCGRMQQDVTYEKTGNLHSHNRQKRKCHQQIIICKVLLKRESVQLLGMVKRVFLVVSSTRLSPLSRLLQKQSAAAYARQRFARVRAN